MTACKVSTSLLLLVCLACLYLLPQADSQRRRHEGEDNQRYTTFAPNRPAPVTSPRPISNKPPGYVFHANRVTLGPDFKPLYKGKVIHRYQLNLTEAARLVDPVPDYYAPGEGPEDDDEFEVDDGSTATTPQVQSTTSAPSHGSDRQTTYAPNKPAPVTSPRPISNKPPGYVFHANRVKLGPDFKPLYKGKVIHRYQLNLTEAARLVDPVPDYYAPGEGPEDDGEDDQVDVEETVTPVYTIPTSAPSDHSAHPTSSHGDGRFTTFAPNRPAPVTSPRPISNKPPGYVFHANRVVLGPDFKPLYKGKVIHRYQLNLTEAARLVDPVPDYYAPGEGPEDDDEDLGDDQITATSPMPSSSTPPSTGSHSSHSTSSHGDGRFTTFAPDRPAPVTSPRPISNKPPGYVFHANRVVLGPDFKPLYKGKVIHRYQLNLTEAARLVDPVPDYYEPGEGPEDDDDDLDDSQAVSSSTQPSVSSGSSGSSHSTSSHGGDHFTTFAPNRPPPVTSPRPISNKPPGYVFHANRVVLGPDFKPLYKGKVIHRYQLNLTEAARLVDPVPDYYEPGEGPMDDDDEDEDLVGGDSNDLQRPSSTSTTSTTTTTTTARPAAGNAFNSFNQPEYDDVDKPEDVDLAVGGISGIFQKMIQGPKPHELNNNSSPEEVYLHLSTIVRDESSKALKATIPRIYDYQYPIGSLLTQRCFNSFAQFGDRMRRGLVWPMRMITASSGISANFALRDYGDFDRCLDVVADDDERRPTEQFFTGQYCMMQLELPLPALNRNISYLDKVLHFNETELGGTFAEFVSENAPFLYSNPKSSGVCVPSTCLPSEIEDVLHYFFKKFHIKVRFNIDCYSKVNLTVNALPGDMVGMNVKELLSNAISPSLSTRLGRLSSLQFWTIIYILVSVVLVLLATLYEVRQIGRSNLRCWSSTERNRPKSFIACFSARYNLEQVANVRDRHMYEMPPPPMPQTNSTNANSTLPGQQANININVSCADDSSTNDSSSESINPKDLYLGTGIGSGGLHGHQSPMYGQVVNTASVDGLKVFALLWICMANFYLLGYQPQMLPSVEHLRDVIMDAKESKVYQLVTQSWLSMEIFFLLSGFLMAYTALPYIARHDGRPNLLYFIAKRALRFLPSMITLLLCISLLPLWKNAGPLYNSGVESILGPCKRFYWRDLFFSSNFYTYEHTCLPHLWYLSVEFQLTLIGIFVCIFAFNRSKHASKAFAALVAVGVFASGYFAFSKQVNITSPLFEKAYLAEIPAILKLVYFSTPVHFSAYFGGLAIGYYARIHNTTRCVPPKAVRVILWTVLPLLTLLAIYLPQHWPFKATFKYGRTMTALYYATFRLLFVSSFAWALFECLHHRASAIKSLLSTSFCRLLSQLSYQIYLINVMVISIYLFTRRTTIQPTTIETLALASILFVITLVIAFFSYLLFEAPYRALFRYYLESPRVLNYMLPVVNANGGKPNGNGNMPFSKGSMLNLNPNFLFSPHYNMVTNMSSRCESEASSLANFSMGSPTVTAGNDPVLPPSAAPPTTNLTTTAANNSAAVGASAAVAANATASSIPKSVSSISMVPNGEVADFNNNKNSGEAYA